METSRLFLAQRVKDVAVSAANEGKAALEQNNFSKAEHSLRKAHLLFNKLPLDENKAAKGEVLKDLIIMYQKKGNIPNALKFAEERLALFPLDFYVSNSRPSLQPTCEPILITRIM